MKLDGFNFDRGIDRILRNDPLDSPLPERGQLSPADAITRPELEQLLALPNLQDFLANALKPDVNNKALLTPQGFQAALQDSLSMLREQADASGPDSDTARLLERAARVLNEEANLRELLTMYRSVLYQG